jgi:hypothetical protein
MAAERYDITIEQGADYTLGLSVKERNGAPVNLTGATIKSHIREHGDAPKVAEFIVIMLDAAAGLFGLSMPGSISDTLPPVSAFYDVILIRSNGIRQRIVEGRVTINRAITHD